MPIFHDYLAALKKHKLTEITEHTHRADLENLLNSIKDTIDTKIKVLHEPKRLEDLGAPDFKITKHDMIIGYVENKKIGENLNEVLKSEQIERYKKLSENILLTDYLDWVWIKSGKDKIDLYNVKKYIPTSFELIRELVGFLDVLNEPVYTETKWIVEEVLSILNTMDIASIHQMLSFNTVPRRGKGKYVVPASDGKEDGFSSSFLRR